MKLSCIDSFSGAGGLALGIAKAGFEIIYSFDLDNKAINTVKLNRKYFDHPAEQLDIINFDSKKYMQRFGLKKGDLELFSGGPPCQGFSVQRIGANSDPRNSLVFLFSQRVIDFQPRFFLMENVPGIAGKRGRIFLESAIKHFEENGYYVHIKTLDAQNYGVPQRRKRVFLVGERRDFDTPKFIFPEPLTTKKTVRDTIFHLPPTPENGKDHPKIKYHRRDKLSALNLERIRHVGEGQGMEHLPDRLLADCHKVGANVIGHRNVYGRMKWDDVAPTITARFDSFTRGMFGHPEQDRSISLHEGALLQTFPNDYIFDGNKVEVARQIGNAVPPQLAYVIARKIRDILDGI